jgi:hypothetical protein
MSGSCGLLPPSFDWPKTEPRRWPYITARLEFQHGRPGVVADVSRIARLPLPQTICLYAAKFSNLVCYINDLCARRKQGIRIEHVRAFRF